VTAIRDAGGGDLEVVTATTTYRTGRVVLAADAWTDRLLAPFGRRLPLQVTKEQVTYFACPDPAAFTPDRFPVWIWMDEPSFYGFPTYGEAGPKVAQDCGGQRVDPDRRSFERDEAAFERVGFVAGTFPPRRPADPQDLPLHAPRIAISSSTGSPKTPAAPSRQGAHNKFASVLGGSRPAGVAGSTPSAPDLERFAIDRPVLLERIRRHPGWLNGRIGHA
jgi:sarcosine oxidase